jgi:hypothetical protein
MKTLELQPGVNHQEPSSVWTATVQTLLGIDGLIAKRVEMRPSRELRLLFDCPPYA